MNRNKLIVVKSCSIICIIQQLTRLFLLAVMLVPSIAFAHGVDDNTKAFLLTNQDVAIIPYIYIGAKHMVTGYDHLLFLVGVIFFLFNRRDIILYVSLFTIGHSITLLYGVLNDIQVNPFLIDAIIAFSIVYKGFDNLGGFKQLFGYQPDTKVAVMIFGLFHGFGLATKIQEYGLPAESMISNILAFNIGVEIGQLLALTFVLILLAFWRRHHSYMLFATATNTLLMACGFMLIGFQLTGYAVS